MGVGVMVGEMGGGRVQRNDKYSACNLDYPDLVYPALIIRTCLRPVDTLVRMHRGHG